MIFVIRKSKGIFLFLIVTLLIFSVSCASNDKVSGSIEIESTVKVTQTVEPKKSESIIKETQKEEIKNINESTAINPQSSLVGIGDNFIVSSDVWKKAFVLHSPNGTRTRGIGFSGISEEINLYTPIDGYIHYLNDKSDGSGRGDIVISSSANWRPAGTMEEVNDPDRDKSFYFTGYGMEPTVGGKVKKGDLVGIIRPGKEVYTEYLKEKAVLVFEPEAEWDKDIERSEDPVGYAKQLVQLIEADIRNDDVFIVSSDVWKKAFVTNFIGGTKNAVIGFSGMSEATIYSPIDGYVHFYERGSDPSGSGNILAVASTATWSPDQSKNKEGDKAIFFFSYGIEPLVFDKVKKGDPIGRFTSGKPVMVGLLEDKADIVISPDAEWGEVITSKDPVEYMKQMIGLIK